MRKNLFLFFLTTLCLPLFSQSFTASVENVGNGYFRLTFTANSKEVSQFTPPSMTDFNVLSGPNSSTYSSIVFVNGKSSRSESTSYTYILSPKRKGSLKIGPASIHIGNRTVRSNALTVQANAQASSPQSSGSQPQNHIPRPERTNAKISGKDVYVEVVTSKSKVYEQEAVLITYRLYYRPDVQITTTQLMDKPEFKGMVMQDLPGDNGNIHPTLEKVNGVNYRSAVLMQYLAFPQQSGQITIPPVTYKLTLLQADQTEDPLEAFFNGGGHISRQMLCQTKPKNIQVQPLPSPRPAGFTGAVGNFEISSAILEKDLRTANLATCRITLKGSGNMKLITPPVSPIPTEFDAYPVKTEDRTKTTEQGQSGEMIFDYRFVPRSTGDFTLPAVSFTFFDPEEGAYRTVQTTPCKLHIEQGKNTDVKGNEQEETVQLAPLSSAEPAPLFDPESVWHRGTLLFFFLLWILLRRWKGGDKWSLPTLSLRRKQTSSREVLALLKQTEKALAATDVPQACLHLENALNRFVQNLLKLESLPADSSQTENLLQQKGLTPDLLTAYHDLLETCHMGRFAPTFGNEMNSLPERAKTWMQQVEELVKEKK